MNSYTTFIEEFFFLLLFQIATLLLNYSVGPLWSSLAQLKLMWVFKSDGKYPKLSQETEGDLIEMNKMMSGVFNPLKK